MRTAYLVTYDVAEPKRWRVVYRLLLGVGDPVQYSVFRCDLSRSEKAVLLEKLVPAVNQGEDRLMFVNLGPASGAGSGNDRLEFWGKPRRESPERGAVIV